MLAVIDLGIGNTGSLLRALDRVGAKARLTASADDVEKAPAVVLPGVGSFGAAMEKLRAEKLDKALRNAAAAGKAVFGICLGMQLLADRSDEHGDHEGLGLLPGRVERLQPTRADVRVPNIGWFDVTPEESSRLFEGVPGCFYHVHSYHLKPDREAAIAATIDYGGQAICVAIEDNNIFGVQFHPERSQDDGFDLLARFVARVGGGESLP